MAQLSLLQTTESLTELQTTESLTDLPEPIQAMLDSINLYWLAEPKSKKRERGNVVSYLRDQWDQVCKEETNKDVISTYRLYLLTWLTQAGFERFVIEDILSNRMLDFSSFSKEISTSDAAPNSPEDLGWVKEQKSETLDTDELEILELCEGIIEKGLETFEIVGNALFTIREKRLYRVTHSTFAEYSEDKWGIKRAQAYRLIKASEVAENIKSKCLPRGDKNLETLDTSMNAGSKIPKNIKTIPTSEKQLRPIANSGLSEKQQLKSWEKAVDLAGGDQPTAQQVESAVIAVKKVNKLAVHQSSADDNWWTPKHIVDLAVVFLGKIELDPCCNDGEPNVPAHSYFRQADNGLDQAWDALTVGITPPYGSEIDKWVHKLLNEFAKGHFSEALILIPSRTDTQWFQLLLRRFPVCFLEGRLTFLSPTNTSKNPAPFPSALFFIGAVERHHDFVYTFCDVGIVCGVLA